VLAEKTESLKTGQNETISVGEEKEQKYILVQVALRLFYEKGYGKVKFSDIAKGANVSVKTVQGYFSAPEEICHQVIDEHLANQAALFEKINQNSNARQRLSIYLDSFVDSTDSLIAWGCPLTNLYFDVKRAEGTLAAHASKLLQNRLDWIREQFVLITRVEDISDLPERLASAIHGIAIMAQVTGNDRLISGQVNQLKSWIRSM